VQLDNVVSWKLFPGTLEQWLADKDASKFRMVRKTFYTLGSCIQGPRRLESKDRSIVVYENDTRLEGSLCIVLTIRVPRRKVRDGSPQL
jgi:hypothetical protein